MLCHNFSQNVKTLFTLHPHTFVRPKKFLQIGITTGTSKGSALLVLYISIDFTS